FESPAPLVNSFARQVGMVASYTALPPSPYMTWLNVSRLQLFVFDHVPLSCVPPITSHESNGLIATLMNCSVLLSLRSMWLSSTGTRESIRLQAMLSPPTTVPAAVVPLRPTSSHC